LIATMMVLSDMRMAPTAGESRIPHGASTPAARGRATTLQPAGTVATRATTSALKPVATVQATAVAAATAGPVRAPARLRTPGW